MPDVSATAAPAIALAPAATAAPTALAADEPKPDDLAKVVRHYYGLQLDGEVEVVESRRDGPWVKVAVKPAKGEGGTRIVYVTPDGHHLVESPIDLRRAIQKLEDDRRFAQCLVDKGVKVFVLRGHEASGKLIAELGAFGHRVALDCSVAPDNCMKLGIANYPTLQKGEERIAEAKPRAWLETWSGCK
jgi:hypothetical protein